MSDVDVLVIGGGPTGLGAAWQLARHADIEWALYEQEHQLGGLSRSIRDDAGYTWDIGGHVCFSHYDTFSDVLSEVMGRDGCFEHERESWIRHADAWVPYPFQNNLHRLPLEPRERCLTGLIQAAIDCAAGGADAPSDFEDFITRTFGEGIAAEFMRPYNRKIWAHPLHELSATWVGERVAVPDPIRAVSNALRGTDDVGWGPNDRFIFPKSGGTGAFWSAVGSALPAERLHTGQRAVRIDSKAKVVEFEDGRCVTYGSLITSAPLDITARMLGDADLAERTSVLARTSTHVIGVGVQPSVSERLGTRCWMYFPSPETIFYRVTNFSHYSPLLAPSGYGSLLVEVAESRHRPVDADRLADDVLQGLVAEGILADPAEVSHIWTYRAEHGYPVPTVGRDAIVERALGLLQEAGIYSRGRFGAWRYEVGNMDHSFMQGHEAAAHLLTGSAELTLSNPGLVNASHPATGKRRAR